MILWCEWLVKIFNRMTSGNELIHVEYTQQCAEVCLWTCYSLSDITSHHLDMLNLVFSENCSPFQETLERLKELQSEMNGLKKLFVLVQQKPGVLCPSCTSVQWLKHLSSPDKVYCSNNLITSTYPSSCTSTGFQERNLCWLHPAAWFSKTCI